MKTAMQKLIDNLEQDYIDAHYDMEKHQITTAINYAKELLEKEKQQIKRAFNVGGTEAYEQSSDDYYNETFN